jgi:hypothetical protein
MSDNWITLIPEDPWFVPDEARRQRARDRFAEMAPDADEVELKVSEKVNFFDCGENFERIRCPSCGAEVPVPWWQDRMDKDYSDGFTLQSYATPCCGASWTLHDLVYEWPQGFGRFALDAMNPNLGEMDDGFRRELEEILGTRLRVIYQHI